VRSLKDLPAVGAAVSLRVHVGRWRCRQSGSSVRFFTGALSGVAEMRGRRTCRADVVTQLIGHALGGRPGERLISRIGLPVSDDTILRRLKTRARAAITGAQVVGIDEWAKRKGLTYGTIVVDLERRTVIDVLGTHTTETVEQWLVSGPSGDPHDLSGPQRPVRQGRPFWCPRRDPGGGPLSSGAEFARDHRTGIVHAPHAVARGGS
jgi:transposase